MNLWHKRELIWELTRRELSQRFRGSYLGFFWTLLNPLLMLLVYTFVFSVIFKARWGSLTGELPPQQYALILFAGLAPFTVFSEVTTRAPNLIVSVPNYVKKVIFPLEVLPVVSLLVALVNSLIGLLLVVVFNLILARSISPTLYLLPLAYVPLLLLTLASGWLLSSLGVYIRDIGQGIGVVVQVLLFATPIVYPADSVPERLRPLMALNPFASIVDGFRQVLLWGGQLHWASWAIWSLIGAVLAGLAYLWFMRTKKGFADVI